MRIVMNLHGLGLGNNGGSRTLIRCAETMARLGADVVIFSPDSASGEALNHYTWHAPCAEVKIVGGARQPEADVAIASGFLSVPSVCGSDAAVKVWYVRGFELWQAGGDEGRLSEAFRSMRCVVCSEWLQKELRRSGAPSEVVYPGLDFEWFYGTGGERGGAGALFHARHATKRHEDAVAIAAAAGCGLRMLNRDVVNASPGQCRELYNGLRVWIAPTELEGLHNPPMEAGLCGCALVCTDHGRSGMSDYALDGETAMVYPARDIAAGAERVGALLRDEALRARLGGTLDRLLREKIGGRERNMSRLLDMLESWRRGRRSEK